MKSTIIIFVLLVANILAVNAQPKNMYVKDVVMAPPNAASLGKFGDIPVSYFTGVPNISIPITTLQEGPLTLPISLSYHASGIKISEPAGWVGLNWNLEASSIVSRTIQGLPDDQGGIGYFFVGASILNCTDPAGPEQLNEAVNGMIDTEPDIFSFNVSVR